ncbi:hypothetical protein C5167_029490 [Papaver somniferum]|nr:hypothetical protein C5167_029490 [Papaver somniferum]
MESVNIKPLEKGSQSQAVLDALGEPTGSGRGPWYCSSQ